MKKTTSLMRQFWVSVSVVWYFGCLLFFCYDSLNSGCLLSLAAIIPIKSYFNAEADKNTIISDNKNKSGIYMWKNLINGKQYIGSAMDLYNRLSFYYSFPAMQNSLKNSKSFIYNAILKHGHSNFSLTIIEYCDKEKCLERENYYLSSENHEYNILETAGSSIGRKHSDKTKTIMSDAKKGEKNPMYGKPKPVGAGTGKVAQKIEVIDKNSNEITVYNSISEAAKALNISHTRIVKYFTNNQQKPYKGQYTFKKI